jgi:carotenoid cleavage dioxygenase-like enzyme
MGRSSELVTVKPEALVPEHLEFPRFNYKLVGQRNQFFYALGNDYLHPNRVKSNDPIVKIDSITRSFCLRHYVQNGLSNLGEET